MFFLDILYVFLQHLTCTLGLNKQTWNSCPQAALEMGIKYIFSAPQRSFWCEERRFWNERVLPRSTRFYTLPPVSWRLRALC